MMKRYPDVTVDVWAMNDGKLYNYPSNVTGEIEQDDLESYRKAARAITACYAGTCRALRNDHRYGRGGTAYLD